MTTILEPVLTGTERLIETTIRRTTLVRWRRAHPELHFTTLATRNDRVRVQVMLKSADLAPASPRCYRTPARSYAAGSARGKKWWGLEVRGEADDFQWLDNFESKALAEEAADAWFMVHGIDPATVPVVD